MEAIGKIGKMYTTTEIDHKSFNDKERSFVAWASRPVIDRDKELIQADAWDTENYEKNKVICWAHDYSKPPVGKAIWLKKQQEGLSFKPQFANTDAGKELYQLYKDGVLNAFSVGFVPKEGGWIDSAKKGDPKRTYTDVELLEISCVSVPSCPAALVEAYESGEIKTKSLKEDVEYVIDKADEVAPVEDAAEDDIVTKPETTEKYHRIPIGKCAGDMRTVTVSKKDGIKGLYCLDSKKITTYLFDVEKWTMAEAKKWIKDHNKEFDGIAEDDLPFEDKDVSLTVQDVEEIVETAIEAKEGRVLSKATIKSLSDAKDSLQKTIEAAREGIDTIDTLLKTAEGNTEESEELPAEADEKQTETLEQLQQLVELYNKVVARIQPEEVEVTPDEEAEFQRGKVI